MKQRFIHIACLMVLLSVPLASVAQETAKEDQLALFKKRAWQDAQNEQALHYTHPEDEQDYWEDQRNFEKAIKKLSYRTYQLYLVEKRKAYAAHQEDCSSACKHGKEYYAMSTFYHTYGKTATTSLEAQEIVVETSSALSKKKH